MDAFLKRVVEQREMDREESLAGMSPRDLHKLLGSRPPVLSSVELAEARRLRIRGRSLRRIAGHFGVDRGVIERALVGVPKGERK